MVHWGEYDVDHLWRLVLTTVQMGISCKWTNDSQQFLLEHLDTINASPSHIYHSALPFSPPSTWLWERYSLELSQEVKVVQGLPAVWGICSRTFLLGTKGYQISCCNNIVAIGSAHKDIIILDAITGSQTAILSGHTDEVITVSFSSDGRSLVSGSDDRTVKLWDMQTGGAIKTFCGHTELVRSVSISVDNATIASGSFDETIRLWSTQTGECHCVIEQNGWVDLVKFSPTNPQHFLSHFENKIWQWDISGHQAGLTFDGYHAEFSPDGTQFVSCSQGFIIIQNLSSGAVVAKFPEIDKNVEDSYFSPDSKTVAVAGSGAVYIWNITSPKPYLVETLIGHTDHVTSLAFSSPSSLISVSVDQSVKFWKISAQSTDLVETHPESIPPPLVTIMSITLRARDNISITSDSDGVVKTWDIPTGICKASFQTPARGTNKRDVQMANGRLILAWHAGKKTKIWDVEKKEFLLAADAPEYLEDIKISKDGSRFYSIGGSEIQAQSIQTGEIIGRAGIKFIDANTASLTVHDSRIWVHYTNAETQVWDFGTLGSPPVQLPNMTLEILHPDGVLLWDTSLSSVKEKATGKVVFWLPKGYGKPVDVQWSSQLLVASFMSGEILVLDFTCVL